MNAKLRSARLKKGWSQEEAAEAVGVAVRTYQRWEQEDVVPNFASRRLLRDAFGCSDSELGFERGSESPEQDSPLRTSVSALPKREILVIPSETDIVAPTRESGVFVPYSLATTLEMELDDWPTWFALKQTQILTMISSWNGRALFCGELQLLVDQEIKVLNEMKPQDNDEAYTLSRRQSIIAIAAFPLALLSSIQGSVSTIIVEELLSRCAASITACWHLLKGSELSIVGRTVAGYLPTLVQLAQQPSRYQKAAACLATQGYRLKGIVALHQNNVKARETCCQRALYYSEVAQDSSSLVAALISLASTSYYDKNPIKAAFIYQKALPHLDKIPPLQRARLSIELAVVYAQQGQEQEALHFMELAQKSYPEHPENDPSFLYAEFTPASMILEEGLTHLALAQHYPDRAYSKNAWGTFARIEEPQSLVSVPRRIFFEITNQQAETALALGDQELFRAYLEKGIQGANALNSKQRRREAIETYKKAQSIWPREPRIRELADLFL
ncbi:MAG TPA: helix-turn-helix transcriptional regulator [Ktedonobacteraceae bacterium]|nr:helix-turn-helix transcriptional regulator [Ktedonobacteraceae bacterium]